jgi:hypothetical protein
MVTVAMRTRERLLILALVLLGSLESMEPAPARLLLAADTVVMNGPASFTLLVAAVDARGDTLSARGLSFRNDASGVVELPRPGVARCRHEGDATVVVNLAGLTARVAIRCRPIAMFGMPVFTRLVLGGDPVPASFIAFDSNGKRITELAGSGRIRDPSVVRWSGGLLHPVSIGGTSLDMDFGGKSSYQPIQVIRRVVHEQLALAAGEIRTWSLPVGRSELLLASDSTNPAFTELLLLTYRANCARGPRRTGEQHWYCIGTTVSKAVVRDARPVGTRGAVRAEFTLFEMR